MRERWVANFSKPERSCFVIKPEISRHAKLEKGSLFLGLKKSNLMAWLETAGRVYVDQVIEARFRLDGLGGYCAAGIMFRVMENGTYYLALVSNRGYFRLDAVNDRVPRTLVGWTEVVGADRDDAGIVLGIVARGDHLVFTLNGKWVAEASDGSIPGGHLGFSLVSYGASDSGEPCGSPDTVCEARLDYLSVDSRPSAVEREHGKWTGGAGISAENRLRLAETFAALDNFGAAYGQVLKAWKQREDAARSVMATYTDTRGGKELLFAARMASLLGLHEKAEEYVNTCLSAGTRDGVNETEVLAEKAKILSALGESAPDKLKELVAFLPGYIEGLEAKAESPPDPRLYALLGHAWWNLGKYQASAEAWSRAFELNGDNGLYAENAAEAYGKLGRKDESLGYFIAGGSRYLRQAEFEKLGALVPRLLAVGRNRREAHMLAWEWAKGMGDFERAEAEFALAEKATGLATDSAGEDDAREKKRSGVARIAGKAEAGTEIEGKPVRKTRAKAASATPEKPVQKKAGSKTEKETVGKTGARAAKVAGKPEKATPTKAAKTKVEKKPAGKVTAKPTKTPKEAVPKTRAAKKNPGISLPARATPKAKQGIPGKKPAAKDKPVTKNKATTKPAPKARKTAK
ncbi:MAG: hypothetical protein FWB79_04385 [Treponema sp.]|nr:hypothetical protein [Treponema sp.]